VQYLKPYYCSGKAKQRDMGVISCHVWYLPVLMLSWLTTMSCFLIIGLHQQHSTETCTCEYSYWHERKIARPSSHVTRIPGLALFLEVHFPVAYMYLHIGENLCGFYLFDN
jgi:hypothetical protein